MREKFQLEFIIHASTAMLYNYISSSSGLSEWFADHVRSSGEKFIFSWGEENENQEIALLIKNKPESYVRFKWEQDEDTKYFFQLLIEKDELTGDVSLIITDFAEPDQLDEAKLLWETQIGHLKKSIGG